MSPEQALQLLNNATAILSLNREGHQQILQALHILEQVIQEKNNGNIKQV